MSWILLGFIIGAFIGAPIGLILHQRSMRLTPQQIRDLSRELMPPIELRTTSEILPLHKSIEIGITNHPSDQALIRGMGFALGSSDWKMEVPI